MRETEKPAAEPGERIGAFFLSAILTIVIVGSMVIIHEISSPFKAFLERLTGHHWVTKSVLVAVIFPVLTVPIHLAMGSDRIRRALRSNDAYFWSILTIATTAALVIGSTLVYVSHYFRG